MELTPLALFDVGGNEIVLILLIVLLLFGGEKMPELARGIGKAMREFKKAASGVEHEIKKAMEEPPAKKTTVLPKQELPPTSLPPHPPFTTPAHDLHEGLEPNKPAGGVTPTETPEPPKNA